MFVLIQTVGEMIRRLCRGTLALVEIQCEFSQDVEMDLLANDLPKYASLELLKSSNCQDPPHIYFFYTTI